MRVNGFVTMPWPSALVMYCATMAPTAFGFYQTDLAVCLIGGYHVGWAHSVKGVNDPMTKELHDTPFLAQCVIYQI